MYNKSDRRVHIQITEDKNTIKKTKQKALAGCRGSQADKTSRTRRYFEGVTSFFLFVDCSFLCVV